MTKARIRKPGSYPFLRKALDGVLTVEWQSARKLHDAVELWSLNSVRLALAQMRDAGEIEIRQLAPVGAKLPSNEYRKHQPGGQ